MRPDHMHRQILASLSTPIIVVDRSYRIVYANAASVALAQPPGNLQGRSCYAVNHWCRQPCWQVSETYCPLRVAAESGTRVRAFHKHRVREALVVEEVVATPWSDSGLIMQERRDISQLLGLLEGMLSMCASCKSIRDREGLWCEVEGYIHDHTGAEFSHTICPECRQKLYPDLFTETGRKR